VGELENRHSVDLPLPGILTMNVNLLPAPVDGRQSPTAFAVARGTASRSAAAARF
jgi:hypothetical protein